MSTGTEHVSALPFPIQATLTMPGSKSHANRAILCACLARGTTIIRNATPCDDTEVMVGNLQKMGFDLRWMNKDKGELHIKGGIPTQPGTTAPLGGSFSKRERPSAGAVVLDCHNAGTTLRFLTSLAAMLPGEWDITGDEHMQSRPIGDLVTSLRSLGADIEDSEGRPPIRIRGGTLTGNSVRLNAAVSSQYLSSLLLIAPALPRGLRIETEGNIPSEGYIHLTRKVMRDFGISFKQDKNIFIVQSSAYQSVPVYDIEGDWSGAGAWLALAAVSGSRFDFTNLQPESEQADRRLPLVLHSLRGPGDKTIDCSGIPDQLMNLAIVAAFRKGNTEFTGAANLRKKECDRLAVMTSELKKVGIKIAEHPDGVRITGSDVKIPKSVTLDPHADHRMAMCFAILGLLKGNIVIKNPECVGKSYPGFFDDLKKIRTSSRPIAVVGMRGAGKSNIAKRLASRLKLTCLDIDKIFESKHGPIKAYIAAHDWPAFRRIEEELVEQSLRPGVIVSLGGGATESKKTRELLKKNAVVIWIQASKAELLKRLQSGKRPAITGLPLHEEVHKLLIERAPNYKDVAHIMIPPGLPFSRQVPFAAKALKALVFSSL